MFKLSNILQLNRDLWWWESQTCSSVTNYLSQCLGRRTRPGLCSRPPACWQEFGGVHLWFSFCLFRRLWFPSLAFSSRASRRSFCLWFLPRSFVALKFTLVPWKRSSPLRMSAAPEPLPNLEYKDLLILGEAAYTDAGNLQTYKI